MCHRFQNHKMSEWPSIYKVIIVWMYHIPWQLTGTPADAASPPIHPTPPSPHYSPPLPTTPSALPPTLLPDSAHLSPSPVILSEGQPSFLMAATAQTCLPLPVRLHWKRFCLPRGLSRQRPLPSRSSPGWWGVSRGRQSDIPRPGPPPGLGDD